MISNAKYTHFQVRFRLKSCLYLKETVEMWSGVDMTNGLMIHAVIIDSTLGNRNLTAEAANLVETEFSTLQLIDMIDASKYHIYIYGWLNHHYKSAYNICHKEKKERQRLAKLLKSKIEALIDIRYALFLHPSVFYFDDRANYDSFVFLPFSKFVKQGEDDTFIGELDSNLLSFN